MFLILTLLFGCALVEPASAQSSPPILDLGPDRFGGRARALLALEDGARQVLLVGDVAGGLWRSENGGDSWQRVAGPLRSVTALAADPSGHRIYAGTGEVHQRLLGNGVFVSDDKGKTWAPVPGTNDQRFEFIQRLAISRNGREMLVATSGGLFQVDLSSGDIQCAFQQRGCGDAVADVAFHPGRSDRAITATADSATVLHGVRGPSGRFQWEASEAISPTDPSRKDPTSALWRGSVALAYAVQNPEIVYASVAGTTPDDGFIHPIWRSEDGGKTFEHRDAVLARCVSHRKAAGPVSDVWANLVWAGHPDDPDFLIVGRVDLWRSLDGGGSLELVSDFEKHPASVHADTHVIATLPSFGQTVPTPDHRAWVATDGGVFSTENLTAGPGCESVTWDRNNQGYGAPQIYAGAALGDGSLVVGTQDLGVLRRDPSPPSAPWLEGKVELKDRHGRSRLEVVRDDILAVVAHPARPAVAFALGNDLEALRSEDGGRTWEYIGSNRWNGVDWVTVRDERLPPGEAGLFQGTPAMAVDSDQNPYLYIAGACLYRTEEPMKDVSRADGPQWFWVPTPLQAPDCTGPPAISRIATHPRRSDELWICHDDGRIFRTLNARDTAPDWYEVFGLPRSERYRACRDLRVTDAGALVVFDGRWLPNVYAVTVPSGALGPAAWLPLRLPKPLEAFAAVENPQVRGEVFVATEGGVYQGTPRGPWALVPGLPEHRTETLILRDRVLYVATYGAGVHRVELR